MLPAFPKRRGGGGVRRQFSIRRMLEGSTGQLVVYTFVHIGGGMIGMPHNMELEDHNNSKRKLKLRFLPDNDELIDSLTNSKAVN